MVLHIDICLFTDPSNQKHKEVISQEARSLELAGTHTNIVELMGSVINVTGKVHFPIYF